MIAHPSPNFGERRNGATPRFIVLHYTAMASAQAALERLCDPDAEVSAHYLIGRDGTAWQLVDERKRAWHAGAGAWGACTDINSNSIGIELDNSGDCPFAEPLMARLEALMQAIMARHGIAADGVIGHSDMAPGRKVDPGPRFDWLRLEQQGLAAPRGIHPDPENATMDRFRSRARAVGYTADVGDEALLSAVRLRFRPGALGPLTGADLTPLSRPGL
ncbi:MAG: N-acetylmuramoyl-L-alanine amidase [Pseudomonadota bacterium]